MKTLTIDRAKWRTGCGDLNMTGRGITQLLNNQGYMCCLGFACLQLGLSPDHIRGYGEPSELFESYSIPENINLLVTEYNHSTKFTEDAININDNPHTTVLEKEVLITKHFKEAGIEVVFTGEYEK